ncbi:MAG: NADH-quinone oxidoreductase subunit N [Desulfobacteraceae bacterium]
MNWSMFLPELGMLAAVAVFLVLACLPPDDRRDYAVAVGFGALAAVFSIYSAGKVGDLFYNAYRVDLFSQVFKILLAFGFLLVVFLCRELKGIAPRRRTECFLLLSVSTLALMLLVSGVHLMAIYMALELSSYSLYVLVFLRKEARWGLVSGLRYFLTGISASAIMLFGLALIYGVTGELHLDALMQLPAQTITNPAMAAGVLMTLGGFFFKLAIFPFHFWAGDVYEGAPNQVAAFISTASKVAAIAVLIRLVDGVHGMETMLAKGLIILAVITMTVGNLCAIGQKDFKRLMAFSSIAQAGYLLVGILCMTPNGYTGTIFYVAAVLVMKFTCFMVMHRVADDGRNLQIAELAGLHRRSPLLALALMMALFGLAGIPPTIGFSGKLLIFKAAIEKGYLALVIIAMVNVVISLYYYLLVLKAAYLAEEESPRPALTLSPAARSLAILMVMAIVAVGFYPTGLLRVVHAAVLMLN